MYIFSDPMQLVLTEFSKEESTVSLNMLVTDLPLTLSASQLLRGKNAAPRMNEVSFCVFVEATTLTMSLQSTRPFTFLFLLPLLDVSSSSLQAREQLAIQTQLHETRSLTTSHIRAGTTSSPGSHTSPRTSPWAPPKRRQHIKGGY